MIYTCVDENRKALLLSSPSTALNGIDFLEVEDAVAPAMPTLMLHCLKAAPTNLTPANVLITGGESITDIAATAVVVAVDPTVLLITTNRSGDFSAYTLRLVNSVAQATGNPFGLTDVLQGFDPQLAEATFSFKIDCGPDFDCTPSTCAPAGTGEAPPPINYLAKDYGSFRTLLLDRLSQLLPTWSGTSEADLGVMLAEMIAYRGDLLSYQQDAIATEAYLSTARSRISLRRHALLVDYHVHDGANARVWMHVEVSGDPMASIAGDASQAVFLDRTLTRFYTFGGVSLRAGTKEAVLQAGVQVFEPMQDALLYPEHNQMYFHTWGDAGCCLRPGATEATLRGSYPNLKAGDVLLFEEVLGPETGKAADSDLRHRWAVRVTQVATRDAYGVLLGDPLTASPTGGPSPSILPVTEIQWSERDALPFALCLSSEAKDSAGLPLTDVSIVRGNVVLADHGLRLDGVALGAVPYPTLFYPADDQGVRSPLPVRFRPVVPDGPLTQAVPLPLAGSPVTPEIVMLDGTGAVSLSDANGFACMLIQPGDPALWPQYFGVQASENAGVPGNIDLVVFYNPPAAATGTGGAVAVEAFYNLSLKASDPSYVAGQINQLSRLIRVPSSYVPPAAPPTAIPAGILMLTNAGVTTLSDSSSPAVPYLSVQPTNPADWLLSLGILAQSNQRTPAFFNLSLVYNPSDGTPGLVVPVTLERFTTLTLATVGATFASASQLITVQSFSQAPNPTLSAIELMAYNASDAVPAITLTEVTAGGDGAQWVAQQDLLGCGESTRAFVVETEFDGTATLRFATPGGPGAETAGTNGMVPPAGTTFKATYRVGNGVAGNLGAESLTQVTAADARVLRCTNPMPACGGVDPETPAQIRRRAPQGFLASERAVTLGDYEKAAQNDRTVNRAVASLRWTGSWYSVFLAVEPKGGGTLTQATQQAVSTSMERFRLAGQDLEVESPQYVALQITLQVTVQSGYFRSDVQEKVLQVLGNGRLPDGSKGFFHPDNFNFGETVYLSPIYAAVRGVAGVQQVAAIAFQPQGVTTGRYLSSGEIKLGTLQVARLENDPSFPDHGQLTLVMQGGK